MASAGSKPGFHKSEPKPKIHMSSGSGAKAMASRSDAARSLSWRCGNGSFGHGVAAVMALHRQFLGGAEFEFRPILHRLVQMPSVAREINRRAVMVFGHGATIVIAEFLDLD